MGCCGKIKKAVSIAKGNLAVVLDAMNVLPGERFVYHEIRLRTCRQCEHHTYLNVEEYLAWVKANGGIEKFLADIENLEGWPPLPIIQDEKPGAKLYCSLCKCWLEAKAYVKNENCPLGHPQWRQPKGLFKDAL